MRTIHMPTSPEVTFGIPDELQIPEIGEVLYLPYEEYITDKDDWEVSLSTLENDVMVVDKIEQDHIWLREGDPD